MNLINNVAIRLLSIEQRPNCREISAVIRKYTKISQINGIIRNFNTKYNHLILFSSAGRKTTTT